CAKTYYSGTLEFW
nr:immunoglobulin heavy chain junction region [Macaca mulatta]MOX60746.1 immunoglobulin heavy chain junction region [Macaca mulatta]MOX61741.1 immunoglobulin heavy chain junction region [Macaca mulatta]MOX63949.1 immunoglobulin heavy chain junction region [Macaca mulatta]MOX64828.1 immunoglobulin heavy chain junction region [Macaca mulatta]